MNVHTAKTLPPPAECPTEKFDAREIEALRAAARADSSRKMRAAVAVMNHTVARMDSVVTGVRS